MGCITTASEGLYAGRVLAHLFPCACEAVGLPRGNVIRRVDEYGRKSWVQESVTEEKGSGNWGLKRGDGASFGQYVIMAERISTVLAPAGGLLPTSSKNHDQLAPRRLTH